MGQKPEIFVIPEIFFYIYFDDFLPLLLKTCPPQLFGPSDAPAWNALSHDTIVQFEITC